MQAAYHKTSALVIAVGDAVVLEADGVHAKGGEYAGSFPFGGFDGNLAESDFIVSDIRGDAPAMFSSMISHKIVNGELVQNGAWTPPVQNAPKTGRDLTWAEFLDVGMATDVVKINAVLAKMPVVAEFGRKYLDVPGIAFADATTPDTRLKDLLDGAVAFGLIDKDTVAAFMATWVEMFPA